MYSISVRHGDAGDAVTSPTLENWPLFGQKFWTFGQIIQLHSHFAEAVSLLPRFIFVGNKDVSPNSPLDNKKNYSKYSEVTLNGVLANGVKTFSVLGKFHAIPHLIWAKVKVALDFGVFFQVNYPIIKK